MGEIISGPLRKMGHPLNVGLKVSDQAETLIEPNVMDAAPTTALAGPTTPIGVISLNAKFVINWVTLPSPIHN